MKSQSPPDWIIAANAFWEGFVLPSRLGALAMLVGFVASLFFAFWFFSPATLIGPTGDYLPRSGKDAAGFVTVDAMRLSVSSPKHPTLLLLGSSVIGQAVGSGEVLRQALQDGTGEEWDVHILSTPLQSPLDQFALLDTALSEQGPNSAPVVVAVGTGLTRLGWTRERLFSEENQHRIGLTSDWLDKEIIELGGQVAHRTDIYVIDHLRFVTLNGTEAFIRFALRSPAQRVVDSYAGPHPTSGERNNPRLRDQIKSGATNQAVYFAQQKRLADQLRSRPNVHLVYLGEPIAPDFIKTFDLAEHQIAMRDAIKLNAEEVGADFFPVDVKADLQPEDFHDTLHVLRGAPQKTIQHVISGYLVNWWNERTSL